MNPELKKEMEEKGFDVDQTLERFMGNEDLYFKFLKKFLEDTNYADMKAAIESTDFDRAFRCAHTLKGVTANLGMKDILNSLTPIVEKLRSGSADGILDAFKEFEVNYKIARVVIEQL